jgi:hypothetical protein
MPGPLPTDPSVRQRRNKTATAAKLPLGGASTVDVPELPERFREDRETGEFTPISWHPRTSAWWSTVWASPMAPEFLDADVEGLFLLAELEDDFHRAESAKERIELAKEIRLQRQCFGLTPIDRRRLQWEVDRGEEAEGKRKKRRRSEAANPQLPGAGSGSRISPLDALQ